MLGERLKKIRVSQGLTQTQLAEMLRLSPSTIGMYEQGRRSPDAEGLANICSLFNISADFLLVGDTNRFAAGDIFEYLGKLEKQMLNSGELTVDGKKLEAFEILKISKAMSFAVQIILDEMKKNTITLQ